MDLSFEDIKGQNTDADAVTENLVLPVGTVLSNGLKVVGWKSSDTQIITNAGGVVRPGGTEDKTVELTPILAIYDGIGNGSEGFEPTDVTAEGAPITVTVKANPEEPTPPEPTETPEPPGETAVTQFLVNEDYEQEITDPTKHSMPSIYEWKVGQTTAEMKYQNGRVYLNKLNDGDTSADLMLPLTKGYVNGLAPAAEGTPATDIYVEFNWQAQNSNSRLYIRGLTQEGKWVNLFFLAQSGTKLRYVTASESSSVTGTVDMKTSDAHTICLLMQKKSDTYAIAKAWIDGRFDKDVNLSAAQACEGLYSFVADERRKSGTGLGSSFGSLRVWQTAEAQLQSMIDSGKADITFDDIKGANANAESVTGNLVLQSGNTLASGLTVVGWETSNPDIITKTGGVIRPVGADATVTLTPVLSIRDVIGDGSADFEPTDVTAKGNPITVTVCSMQLEEVKKNLTFEQIKGDNIDSEHVESDLKLPAKMNGVDIAWQVKSMTPAGTKAAVDTATGSVRRPAQNEQDVRVVLTAVLSRGDMSDEKELSFTVKKMTVSDAEYLQQIAQKLTFAAIGGENMSAQQVSTDLNLTNKFGGADVVWSSSDPSVVALNGKVNCPVYPNPSVEVVLTASLTLNGEAPVKKEIRVTVMQGEAVNLAVSADVRTNLSGLTADKLKDIYDNDEQTFYEISARTKEFYITFDLKEKKAVSRLDFVTCMAESVFETALKGYAVEVSDNGTTWTEVCNGTAISGRNVADFKPVNARYVRLRVTEKSTDTAENFAEIAVRFCPEHQNLVDADAENLSIDLPSRITANTVTLPTKGAFGSDIAWSFSPAGVFEQTSEKGVYRVNHSDSDTTVSLIATFKSGGCTAQVRRTHTVSGKSGGGAGGGGGGGGSHSSTGSGSNASNMSIPTQGGIEQPPVQPTEVFSDLAQAAWASDYIKALYRDGIVNGKGAGQFAPLDSVTREEFVKMLVLALNMEAAQKTVSFADTDNSAWYAPYIACAVENGLVNGITDTVFGVGLPITREDMSVMAARAILMRKDDIVTDGQPLSFGDGMQISDYARESVALLSAMGLISGNESGNFCPQENTSRAESAKILYMLRDAVR